MIRSIHSFAGKQYLAGKIAPNGGIYTMSESSICMLERLRSLREREPNRLLGSICHPRQYDRKLRNF